MQMRASAPKAPPMMAPMGTSDFPCAGATVAAITLDLGSDEEDWCVEADGGDDEVDGEEDCCVGNDDVDDEEEDESDGEDCSVEDNDGDDEEEGKRVSCTISRKSSKSVSEMGLITSVCWPVGERGSD